VFATVRIDAFEKLLRSGLENSRQRTFESVLVCFFIAPPKTNTSVFQFELEVSFGKRMTTSLSLSLSLGTIILPLCLSCLSLGRHHQEQHTNARL